MAQVSVASSTILERHLLLASKSWIPTKSRFSLYHAQIWVLDRLSGQLQLAAGAGPIGRQMVSRGRSVPLDRDPSAGSRSVPGSRGTATAQRCWRRIWRAENSGGNTTGC